MSAQQTTTIDDKTNAVDINELLQNGSMYGTPITVQKIPKSPTPQETITEMLYRIEEQTRNLPNASPFLGAQKFSEEHDQFTGLKTITYCIFYGMPGYSTTNNPEQNRPIYESAMKKARTAEEVIKTYGFKPRKRQNIAENRMEVYFR